MIQYRKASPKDFLSIAKLDREAWKSNRHSEYIPDGEHAWRHWVEHGLVYCAEKDQEILGAILAFPCTTGEYCIHKVFVDKEYRGQQIGSRLFERLFIEIDRLEADSFLTVDPLNETAIGLYTKWGFTSKQFVRGYYREYEDRYILTRPYRRPK